MARKHKTKTVTGTVASVSDAFAAIEDLRDELQEWYDNLPENFRNGDKGSQLYDAIYNLEQDSEPSLPDSADQLEITWNEVTSSRSRSTRRDNACAIVDAAISEIESRISELEGYTYNEDGKRHEEGTVLTEGDCIDESDRDEIQQEYETLRDELDNARSNWESAEFPGMYG